MSSKTSIGAVALTAALLVSGGLYAQSQAARAQEDAGPNASCSSSSPCLTESNTGSGAGVKSTSSTGNGSVATTKALGTTSTNGRSGLLGQDLQTKTGDGLFNAGVSGTSTNGTGVTGSGTVGMSAATNSTTGTALKLTATTGSFTTALLQGYGFDGLSVFSVDSSGNAVFGDTSLGVGGGVTARGYSGNDIPLFTAANESGTIFGVVSNGFTFANGFGVEPGGILFASNIDAFNGPAVAVGSLLSADEGLESVDPVAAGTNYTAADSAGVTWLYQGYSTTAGKYTVEMGDSGSVYARIFITMDAPQVEQPTSSGSLVDTYAPQITEPSIEDFGEAQLVSGIATVRLDPHFAATIDGSAKYFVDVTPEGDCRGLFVAQRDPGSFVVRELQGGRSTIAFTYRIVAKPLGNDGARLAPATLPYGFTHHVPSPVVIRRPAHVKPPRVK